MKIPTHSGLRYTINLSRKDGTIYRTKGLTFDELANHIQKESAVLKKIRLGKYGPIPYIPNYRNPRIPKGSVVLLSSVREPSSKTGSTKITGYANRSFKSPVILEPGMIGLVLGYKYHRFVVTYFDNDIQKSSRYRKITPTRSLRFVTVNRYAVVLVDGQEFLIWEGNLKHVPEEHWDILPTLQADIKKPLAAQNRRRP